jgi:beta-lactamase superfamily II metal-dependent hydrolase
MIFDNVVKFVRNIFFKMNNPSIEVQFLPAGCGDAIIIMFREMKKLVVIDFGSERLDDQELLISYLKEAIQQIGQIDLFVISHMDDDHIGGVVSMFKQNEIDITNKVNEWWLNHSLEIERIDSSKKISSKQEVDLKEFLVSIGKCPEEPILKGDSKVFSEIRIDVLSPDIQSYNNALKITLAEERRRTHKIGAKISDHNLSIQELKCKKFVGDTSLTNRSSIAILIIAPDFKGLFLADSHPDIIINSLKELNYNDTTNKLKLDFVKISHHGSRKNTNDELLSLLDCSNFIISSNGINRHSLPDKEPLARIASKGRKDKIVNIFFTHKDSTLESVFSKDELNDPSAHFKVFFPENNVLKYPFINESK